METNGNTDFGSQNSRGFVSRLYAGECSLVMTFWVYYIAVSILISLVPIFGGLFSRSLIYVMVVYDLYLLAMIVPVWRSAGNYQGLKLWSILAKVVVVVFTIGAVLRLVMMTTQ